MQLPHIVWLLPVQNSSQTYWLSPFHTTHSINQEIHSSINCLQTYNTDKQVPDSAGTATALFSAVKTKYGVLGLDSTCQKYSMETGKVQGLMTWAQKEGKRTGFVTTTRVTHATPAALYAHTPERDYEGDEIIPTGSSIMDIAKQLVDNAPGNKFNVIMGGGRVAMGDPDPVPPEIPFKFEGSMEKIVGRKDGVNLADLWLERKEVQDGYAVYVHNRSELNKVDTKQTDYLLGNVRLELE